MLHSLLEDSLRAVKEYPITITGHGDVKEDLVRPTTYSELFHTLYPDQALSPEDRTEPLRSFTINVALYGSDNYELQMMNEVKIMREHEARVKEDVMQVKVNAFTGGKTLDVLNARGGDTCTTTSDVVGLLVRTVRKAIDLTNPSGVRLPHEEDMTESVNSVFNMLHGSTFTDEDVQFGKNCENARHPFH